MCWGDVVEWKVQWSKSGDGGGTCIGVVWWNGQTVQWSKSGDDACTEVHLVIIQTHYVTNVYSLVQIY